MDFRSDDTLFAYDASNAPTHMLYTVNTFTGAATLVGVITPSVNRFAAMDAHPATGVLYASELTGSGGSTANLVTINTGALTNTVIGATATGLDALAFAPLGGVPSTRLPAAAGATGTARRHWVLVAPPPKSGPGVVR